LKKRQAKSLPFFPRDGSRLAGDANLYTWLEKRLIHMNSGEATSGTAVRIGRKIKKRIIPLESSDPVTEPLFINFAHGSFVGGTAYLDIGVITLESLDPETLGDEADFAVLTRLVMSKETLIVLRDQVNHLLEYTEKENAT
jgi:hypothetical protein